MNPDYSLIQDDNLLYNPQEDFRATDFALSKTMSSALLVMWVFCGFIALLTIFVVKAPWIGAGFIALPTFIGMVIRPSFALSLWMLVLPTGVGVNLGQIASLNRVIGFAVAITFAMNISVTRPHLSFNNKFLWLFMAYVAWVVFISFLSPVLSLEYPRLLTHIQLLVGVCIVYWILTTNDKNAFRWILRSYIIGVLGSVALTYMTGVALSTMQEETMGRLSATAGGTVDANMLGVIVGLAFFAAIYLILTDRNRFLRLSYALILPVLAVFLLKTGSRGAALSLVATLGMPFLFVRQMAKKPSMLLFAGIIVLLVAGGMFFVLHFGSLDERVFGRLTDIEHGKESLGYRMMLNKVAIQTVMHRPWGTSVFGWFSVTQLSHWPHSDLFFALGIYGFPGFIILFWIMLSLVTAVRKMPLGAERFFARAILTFLFVNGLVLTQLTKKHYWIFLVLILVCDYFSRFRNEDQYSYSYEDYEQIEDSDYQPYVSQ